MKKTKYKFVELEEEETKIKTRIRKYNCHKHIITRLNEEAITINSQTFINFLS